MSLDKPANKNANSPATKKGRNPRGSKDAENSAPERVIEIQLECHIHDNSTLGDEIIEIRANVCVYDEPLTEFEGKYYCLFHLPSDNKDKVKFEKKFSERLGTVKEIITEAANLVEDEQKLELFGILYDFRYVWFPSPINLTNYNFLANASFRGATFSAFTSFRWAIFSGEVDFVSATISNYSDFSSATFDSLANFSSASFSAFADFSSATFSALADFNSAAFGAKVDFRRAVFAEDANFRLAAFSFEADFRSTIFLGKVSFRVAAFEEKSQVFFVYTVFYDAVNFRYANFKGYVAFMGKRDNCLFNNEKSRLDLQNARIDDAKKISFHTVRLEPGWFINTDASEFVFTDCTWSYVDGSWLKVKRELKNLKDRGFENPNPLLTKTCWQLADNHEQSKSFAKASLFRRFANESRRLELPWIIQPLTLHWWYYAVSFYGERWTRAVFMLIGILVLFGLLYASSISKFDYSTNPPKPAETFIGKACGNLRISANPDAMTLCDGIVHSLAVASFQRPDPKAADVLTKFLVTLETILAPLQAALLALAIRRKFMR